MRVAAGSLTILPHSASRPLRRSPGSDDSRSPPVRDAAAMTRERWMALSFATGSLCFLIGPFPGYVELVGPGADAVTFFVGSLLFTGGGALQVWLALGARGAALWSAVVQSAGTLFFNVTTFTAMHNSLSNPDYDKLVWRPDAFGSICFLVSGVIAYAASTRRGWLPVRGTQGWWEPAVNLLGCSSSRSRPWRAMSCRRRARCSISPWPTGTRHSARRASSPARWPRCAAVAHSRRRGCTPSRRPSSGT